MTLRIAAYRSKCPVCGRWINRGDLIVVIANDAWIHTERCARAEPVVALIGRASPTPAIPRAAGGGGGPDHANPVADAATLTLNPQPGP